MPATPTLLGRTNYNALVDDSGGNLDGSNWSKNQLKITTLDPVDALFSGAAPFYFGGAFGIGTYYPTTTGTQNDWDIDTANGFTVGHLYCNNATLLTIAGIKPPTGNRLLFVTSVGAGDVALSDQAVGSTAADRIITGVSATLTLPAGVGRAVLIYDLTAARWRVLLSTSTYTPALPTIQTTTATGTQNDFALTAGVSVLRCNNATLLTFNGFAPGYDGQRIQLVSVGAGQVDLAHQNAGSTAADRLINFATSGNTSLAAGVGTAVYVYDATTARWRLAEHEQGAFITRTYAGGNFTASAGTWTVDSGDVLTDAYILEGRKVTWIFDYELTSTSAGFGTDMRAAIPGGFTPAKQATALTRITDNATLDVGKAIIPAAGTYMILRTRTEAAWQSSITNLDIAAGDIRFEVT